jgi:hypothetical protein
LFRIIWGSATLAILDGTDDLHHLPKIWTAYGPPDAVSTTARGRPETAAYARPGRLPPFDIWPPPERPTAVFIFHSRRLGELFWFSDDDPRDLTCMLEECGLPCQILLLHRNSVFDGISKLRRHRVPPAAALLTLAVPEDKVLTD